MAKKRTRRGSGGGANQFNGFVNFSLGQIDKKNIRQSVADNINPLPLLYEIVEEGYSIKIAWDDYSNSVSVMLFGQSCKGDNQNWGMSCRHPELEMALHGAIYQHTQLSGDDNSWPKPSDIGSEFDW